MSDPAKPLPDPEDPLIAPYWAAARKSLLVIQECANCGYLRWPPTPVCPECQSENAQWAETSATGELWSYATYHRALDRAFQADVPYTVGLIQLDSGPRMVGTVLAKEEELGIGKRVRGVFDAVTPDVTIVRWELAPDE
jgi:uncharacterized protein